MENEITNKQRRTTWAVLIPALLIPGIGSLAYFVWLDDSSGAQSVYGLAKLFILLWPLLATFLFLRHRSRLPRKSLREHLSAVPAGLILGLIIAGAMAILMATPVGDVVRAGAPAVKAKVVALGFLESFVWFALFVTLFHSLLEEYYWRWFVYGNLRDVIPRPAAHAIAAIGFSLHHIVVTAQFFPLGWALFFSFSVAVGGWFWSMLFQRQGTLMGAWVCHAVVDAALMILGWHLLTLN